MIANVNGKFTIISLSKAVDSQKAEECKFILYT